MKLDHPNIVFCPELCSENEDLWCVVIGQYSWECVSPLTYMCSWRILCPFLLCSWEVVSQIWGRMFDVWSMVNDGPKCVPKCPNCVLSMSSTQCSFYASIFLSIFSSTDFPRSLAFRESHSRPASVWRDLGNRWSRAREGKGEGEGDYTILVLCSLLNFSVIFVLLFSVVYIGLLFLPFPMLFLLGQHMDSPFLLSLDLQVRP
jgi:hypothetical protein